MNDLRLTTAALLALGFATSSYGVNALRDIETFTQPDGSVIELRRVGDENAHYLETADHLMVLPTESGRFEFATLIGGTLRPTGIPATSAAGRGDASKLKGCKATDSKLVLDALRGSSDDNGQNETFPRRLQGRAAKGFPTLGEARTLVILVEYTDRKFNLADPAGYYNGLLNTPGFSEYGATGSAKEYFEENSNGLFSPVFDVYGPVLLSNNSAYYGANSSAGRDIRAHEMVTEAAAMLDAEINFADYDLNGDGYIDNIFVVYAGQGEASYGDADSVWPHSALLSKKRIYKEFDGVFANRYACTNEWLNDRPDGLGTFVHEFSHVLGLPDLYNTENVASTATPGSWSVMDYGQYNNRGCTPPNYSAFERFALGWLDPTPLSASDAVRLESLGDSNEAFLINSESDDTEYFLIENRQNEGWDSYLPSHGMMVWHIEYQADRFASNKVNTDDAHQLVDIVEACGSADCFNTYMMMQYAWNGLDENDTVPAERLTYNNGAASGFELSAIAEAADGALFFAVNGKNSAEPHFEFLPESGISETAAELRPEINGRNISFPGQLRLMDLSGKVVAQGNGSVEAPATGLFIFTTEKGCVKILVK